MNGIDPTRLRPRNDDDLSSGLPATAAPKSYLDELPEGLDRSPDLARRIADAKNMLAANAVADHGKTAKLATLVDRPVLIADGMSPSDVRQAAGVGDCTVESTLASIARTPKGQAWLAGRITTQRDAQGDIVGFTVLLKVKTPAGTYVDKPVDVDPRKFVLGHSLGEKDALGRTEVWPLVWEAAIAKEVGGVAVISAGSNVPTSSAFITGKPAIDSTPKEESKLDQRMLADFAAGKLQTLSTNVVASPNPLGLFDAHAYTVMDVRPNQPVAQADGTTKLETLVVVRNPWGTNDPRPMTIAEVKRDFAAYSVGDIP